MSPQGVCGAIGSDNVLHVDNKHLQNILFDEHGLQCVYVDGNSVYYVNSRGKSMKTFFFDNGCDYFNSGLARTLLNGKAAFFDRRLDVVLKTEFDFASPFHYDHAVVCYGPLQEKSLGEHSVYSGGRCGLINREGTLVLPAEYSLEDDAVFQRYVDGHSECGAPPVRDEKAAICHAKRHARFLDMDSEGKQRSWLSVQVEQKADVWLVRYRLQGGKKESLYEMTIDKQDAGFRSLITQEASR